ncbi:hypothetical protein EVAR_30813_1 [Eumeta japonica]|uniref:Uncharacterized protein n=1 Tax=Eumeta variegata TaxID=151549 RepID=A0A4C2A9K6_EUMVA|nr:hypothetical protein EVAR_30813_1 [Eumeta japonica]
MDRIPECSREADVCIQFRNDTAWLRRGALSGTCCLINNLPMGTNLMFHIRHIVILDASYARGRRDVHIGKLERVPTSSSERDTRLWTHTFARPSIKSVGLQDLCLCVEYQNNSYIDHTRYTHPPCESAAARPLATMRKQQSSQHFSSSANRVTRAELGISCPGGGRVRQAGGRPPRPVSEPSQQPGGV